MNATHAKIKPQIAKTHSRMFELAIVANDRQRAHDIVERAFVEIADNGVEPGITMDSHCSQVLPERTATVLAKYRVEKISELVGSSLEQIAAMEFISEQTAEAIQLKLQEYGFSLRR